MLKMTTAVRFDFRISNGGSRFSNKDFIGNFTYNPFQSNPTTIHINHHLINKA